MNVDACSSSDSSQESFRPQKPTYRFEASDPPAALAYLRSLPVWITWDWVWRDDHWTKPPHSAASGRMQKDWVNASGFVGTFDQALTTIRKRGLAGIGISLGHAHLSGIDLDDCITDSGSFTQLAAEVLEYGETYAEISPSGEGVHLLARQVDVTIKRENVEIYHHGRYFTVTGDKVEGAPDEVRDAPLTLIRLTEATKRASGEVPPTKSYDRQANRSDLDRIENALRFIPADDRNNWISIAMALKSELGDGGFGLWREWSMSSVKWDESAGRRQWGSIKSEGGITISTLFGLAKQYGWRPVHKDRTSGVDSSDGGAKAAQEENIELHNAHISAWPIMESRATHGIVGDIARLATENSEADPVAVIATTLAFAGAEFGRSQFIRIGDTVHHSRHFNAIVGQSARARKGTSFNPVRRIFERAEEIRLERSTLPFPSGKKLQVSHGPLSSGEGLVYAVRDGSDDPENDDPGVVDKRLLVVEEELGSALRAFQRNGNNLSMIVRRAYDGNTIAPMTKSNRVIATDPHINIIAHITQAELGGLLTTTEICNGLANRFQWLVARRPKLVPCPEPMPSDVVETMARELSRVISMAHEQGGRELVMSNSAQSHWAAVYPELTRDYPGVLGAVTSRQEAHARRLALTYAQLDGAERIEIIHLEAALAFCRFAFDSAAYLFGKAELNPAAQKILDALAAGPMTQTEIMGLFHRNMKAGDLTVVLRDLQEGGRITLSKVKSGDRGRAASIWTLTKETN